MPAINTGTANGSPATVGRTFTLPQLKPVNFSLTDGTNIPPPPDSPVKEEKPTLVPKREESAPKSDSVQNGNGLTSPTSPRENGSYDGRGRTNTTDTPPLSPTSTTRPSSIRRFLSRKSLNTNYTNGTNTNRSQEDLSRANAVGMDRPASSLSSAKRSTSWFRRLAGSSNRTSVVYENGPQVTPQRVVPKGPPPPTLPELDKLKARVERDDGGSLGGGDLFKNIK